MTRNMFGMVMAAGFVAIGLQTLAQSNAREVYQQRQAVQEVQRLSSQFDQLQNGMESL